MILRITHALKKNVQPGYYGDNYKYKCITWSEQIMYSKQIQRQIRIRGSLFVFIYYFLYIYRWIWLRQELNLNPHTAHTII